MMIVTEKVLNEKMKNLENETLNRTGLMVQKKNANGKWGKPYLTQRFGQETDNEVIDRLTKLNNKEYRIA